MGRGGYKGLLVGRVLMDLVADEVLNVVQRACVESDDGNVEDAIRWLELGRDRRKVLRRARF